MLKLLLAAALAQADAETVAKRVAECKGHVVALTVAAEAEGEPVLGGVGGAVGDLEVQPVRDGEAVEDGVVLPVPRGEGGGEGVRVGSPEALASGQRVGVADPRGLREGAIDPPPLAVIEGEPERDAEARLEALKEMEPAGVRLGAPEAVAMGQREGVPDPRGLSEATSETPALPDTEGEPLLDAVARAEPLSRGETLGVGAGVPEAEAMGQREGVAVCARVAKAVKDSLALAEWEGEPVSEPEAGAGVPLGKAEPPGEAESWPEELAEGDGEREETLLREGSPLRVAEGVPSADRVPAPPEGVVQLDAVALGEAQLLPV